MKYLIRTKKNQREGITEIIVSVLICLFVLIAMLWRVERGVEITDESWYVAEQYIVAQGAVPFADNLTQAPGFTMPSALLFKLFITISGGTEGIFLFSRYLYVAWLAAVAVITFFIIRKYTTLNVPVVTISIVIAMGLLSMFDISYNTIGQLYLPLVLALVFAEFDDNEKKSLRWGIIAGIIAGRMVIGTPQTIVPCVVVGVYLIINKKWRRVQGIFVGIIIAATMVVGYACLSVGIKQFVNGMYMFINDLSYLQIERRQSLVDGVNAFRSYLAPTAFFLLVLLAVRFWVKNVKIYEKIVFAILCISLVCGFGTTVHAYIHGTTRDLIYCLARYTWYIMLFYYLFYPNAKNNKTVKIATVISLAYMIGFTFSEFSNIWGYNGSRAYWFYPSLIISFLVFYETNSCMKEAVSHAVLIMCLIGLLTVRMVSNFSYVYRDESINLLTTKVESGVYKGCYTTAQRANDVIELEKFLRSITLDEDKILLLDWVSFGYTMANGEAWTPTALDFNGYTYGAYTNIAFDYFRCKGDVPNKIIYIDFGRDEHLSIEDESWEFNGFVEKCYQEKKNDFSNNTFRVREFVLSDKKEAWQMVESKSENLPFK